MARPRVTPQQLALMWMQDETRLVCRRPVHLEHHPDLALRIRGAFGRALARAGAPVAHRFDPFQRPPGFQILFEPGEDAMTGRPMAIDAEVLSDSVVVNLRLFGAAGFWIDQARAALVEALDEGVTLRLGGRNHVRFEVTDCLQRRACLPDLPECASEAQLVFRTPVRVRSGARTRFDAAAIVWSAVTRARGLAAWQEVELVCDEAALRAELDALAFDDGDVLPMHFHRHSQRQGNAPIEVSGALGRLSVRGRLREFIPFLSIGEQTHIGSHAALGLGRYDLALYP